ncbi:zinc ribbon domain-containing protein [Candidatus Pantoea formicae]|uniref:zinc ribbon domain-containing protein n=1 Tax=Candidatus Pantoea formicae TaxID=2608355 RepID=UPI003EDB38F0
METLKLANMMKNRRLARRHGQALWQSSPIKRSRQGGHLVRLDQWFASSKTRHCCGHKIPEMSLELHEWTCPGCRADHGRDINAAINIQRKGITELMAAGHAVKAHEGLHKSGSVPVAA